MLTHLFPPGDDVRLSEIACLTYFKLVWNDRQKFGLYEMIQVGLEFK